MRSTLCSYRSFIAWIFAILPYVFGSNNHPTRHHHIERGSWNMESDQNQARVSMENLQFFHDLNDLQSQINHNDIILNLTYKNRNRNMYNVDNKKSIEENSNGSVKSISWISKLLSNYTSEEKLNDKNNFYRGDQGNPYSRYYFSFNTIDKNKSIPDIERRSTGGDRRTARVNFAQGPFGDRRKLDSFKSFESAPFGDQRRRLVALPRVLKRREENRESVFMRHNITVETLNKRSEQERSPKMSYERSNENNSTESDLTWNISFSDKSSNLNNTGTKIFAQVGGDALLPCRVGHLGDRQVSWIRRRDWYVLTSGEALYTHDDRFVVLHEAGSQDWTLHIKRAVKGDSGIYECQVSTGTGIISFFVRLEIVTPKAHITGNGRTHVYRGSPFTILCYIVKSPSPIQHVMWYHNGNYLNYKRERTDIKITTKNQNSRQKDDDNDEELSYEDDDKHTDDPDKNVIVSRLKVEFATEEHSGNYTCSAPNVMSDSTLIYVTEGDKTAAVQRIDSGSIRISSLPFWPLIGFVIAFSVHTTR